MRAEAPATTYQLVERLAVLIQALREERVVTLAGLAARSDLYDEALPKTLQRDVGALRFLGYRIEATRGAYELLAEPVQLDLSEDEVQMLALLRMAFPPGHIHRPAIEMFMGRLRSLMKPSAVAQLDEPPPLQMALTPAINYEPHRKTLMQLQAVLRRKQQVRFDYQAEEATRAFRLVEPTELQFLHGHFYLLAWVPEVEQELEFRLDRIVAESVRPLPPAPHAVTRSRRPIQFVYRLAPRIARRGVSERFANQKIVGPDSDGWTVIRAEGNSAFRICQELLRYGQWAELLEPAWLRQQLADTIAGMARRYHVDGSSEDVDVYG